ncbi:hypothetical protein NAC44_11985 [Allorhizobium sp. BGMRC 0089]|uniref:structural cement protein Gp24 n=1 Tax=Allorhizobium sonneratiae TaxID=2934936 RepID=UPI002034555A|nr:hypothetical protein [Allorhizobium sonneratiae]MCM2293042.1 hypothetical protein [Allorhizobium sonneratiae]
MATYQTTYSANPPKGLPGQIANEEKCNKISRTVESAAGIEFGQPAFRGSGDHGVVAGGTFAGTATSAAGTGNTGDGVMGAVTVSAGAKQGIYTLLIIEPAANAGTFEVTDPDGVFVDNGTVGTAFSAGGLAFTLADGATDFVAGDSFNITVSLTANGDFVGLAVLNPAVPASASLPDAYPQYFTGAFMTMGQMYVVAGESVADGDDVYWNPATKRYTKTTTHIRIPNAEFDTTGANGDIVEISLKLR